MSTFGATGGVDAEAAVVRIWRTEIDPQRADEYAEFALTRSVPMFRRQDGFVSVIFCGQGSERLVITLWRDRESVDELNESETYQATVREIEAAGFLRGMQSTDVFDLHAQAARE